MADAHGALGRVPPPATARGVAGGTLWATFVSIAVVTMWRGTWEMLDTWLGGPEAVQANLISFFVGVALTAVLVVAQPVVARLAQRVDSPRPMPGGTAVQSASGRAEGAAPHAAPVHSVGYVLLRSGWHYVQVWVAVVAWRAIWYLGAAWLTMTDQPLTSATLAHAAAFVVMLVAGVQRSSIAVPVGVITNDEPLPFQAGVAAGRVPFVGAVKTLRAWLGCRQTVHVIHRRAPDVEAPSVLDDGMPSGASGGDVISCSVEGDSSGATPPSKTPQPRDSSRSTVVNG